MDPVHYSIIDCSRLTALAKIMVFFVGFQMSSPHVSNKGHCHEGK